MVFDYSLFWSLDPFELLKMSLTFENDL